MSTAREVLRPWWSAKLGGWVLCAWVLGERTEVTEIGRRGRPLKHVKVFPTRAAAVGYVPLWCRWFRNTYGMFADLMLGRDQSASATAIQDSLGTLLNLAGVTTEDQLEAAARKIAERLAQEGCAGEAAGYLDGRPLCPLEDWLERETGLKVWVSAPQDKAGRVILRPGVDWRTHRTPLETVELPEVFGEFVKWHGLQGA